ncbi:MAG: DUF1553 domain-containing protein, partial [Pirellulaceae bacterium]|nr:DUF1553 domain-containing protein [Pirellulaceae bacterium]
KPYDQVVREQIAGDALGEPMATGFLVAGPNDIVKGQDKLLGLMQRQDELSDIVNTVGTALLGLTTGCARCHNHKFDPISQVDFYALQAIFAGVEHGDRDLPLAPDQQQQVDALNEAITQTRHELSQLVGVSALREAVNPQQNSERFPARNARYVRFTINQSSSGQPCIDELEIFSGQTNVGLASAGARATSSGNFEHPLHKLAHLNDGRFGNPHSWICSQTKAGWAQIELPQPMEIDRIEWGRDREGKFADRLAIDYRIDVSLDGQTWESVASSENRLPFQRAPNSRQRYDLSQVASGDLPKAQAALQRLDDLQQRLQTWLTVTKVYAGTFKQPPVTHRLFRGDPTAPREEVPPGAIQSLGSLSLPANATDQQRRLAIADWITRADNPLAPRVIVNRLWQFHFGTGIVDTPSDFGANGTPPSHPELLDWLANELVNSGWSLKHIHRLILTSKTWQQSSQPQANALAIDAQSRLLWRFPPRRLEAEPIRDSLLAVSGNLDLNMGGPGFSAFEVELENVRHYFPKQNYGPADWRRMIYMTKVRQEKDSTFGVFDCPDASQVTPKRSRSTTPLQALNLLNGRFVLQQAELLAKRLSIEAPTNSARIQLAYELCFSRAADAAEQAAAADFIDQHGLVSFTRAILNANEFVFVP